VIRLEKEAILLETLHVIIFSEFRLLYNSNLGYSATQTYQTNNY